MCFPGRFAVGLGLLWLCITSIDAAPKPPLFPLQEGNIWILEAANGEQRIITCDPGTNKLLQVTGLTEHDIPLYGKPFSPKLYRLDTAKNKFRKAASLRPFKRGRSTCSVGNNQCDQLMLELAPVDFIVRTVTGEYTGCSALWITAEDPLAFVCRELQSERIYFAPGVGPVLIQGRLDRLYQLVAALVGDELILPEDGFSSDP